MNTIILIGAIAGASLIAIGFLHFIFVDWLFKDKPYYEKLKYWIGKVTIALTIIFFQMGVIALTILLTQKGI